MAHDGSGLAEYLDGGRMADDRKCPDRQTPQELTGRFFGLAGALHSEETNASRRAALPRSSVQPLDASSSSASPGPHERT